MVVAGDTVTMLRSNDGRPEVTPPSWSVGMGG
jgi:hypothetical protein